MKFHAVSIAFLVLAVIFLRFATHAWVYVTALGALYTGILTWGSFDIRQNFFLKSVTKRNNPPGKFVALTFDDGPTEITEDFLDLLQKFNAHATFFCIGKQIELYTEVLKKTISGGHEIGNHTYSHSNSTGFFGTKKMMNEILLADQAIFNAAGIQTKLYRPPFGVTNPNIASAVKQLGKTSIGWNVRSLDTVLKNEKKIAGRILRKTTPGSIILMHDTSEKSLRALEILLLNLQKENYQIVTVSELLKNISDEKNPAGTANPDGCQHTGPDADVYTGN